MPAREPYSIIGKVYDLNGTTIISGATVTIKNTSDDTRSTTSEADGSYALDVASLTTAYTNGDKIILTATYGSSPNQKYREYILTIDTTGEMGEIKNITLSFLDILDRVNDMISSNWQSYRTENETPLIDKVFNQERVDLTSQSFIATYTVSYITRPQGLGDMYKQTIDTVSLDVRSTISRNRTIKIKDEIERILDANTKTITGYSIMQPLRIQDLSNRSTGLWRFVIDADFKRLAVSRI